MEPLDQLPPPRIGRFVLAGALLALPLVALLWVSTYAREGTRARRLPVLLLVPAPLGLPRRGPATYLAYRLVVGEERAAAAQRRVTRGVPTPLAPRRMRTGEPASTASQLIVVIVLFVRRHRDRASWPRAGGEPSDLDSACDEWGLGGRGFGTCRHLVPARRRPLHGLHVRRRAGGDVRHRRGQRASSRCRTRSWSTRSSSSSWPGCGRSRTATATSRRPTSSAAATARTALSLAVAVTGILATMPYIALQLVGIQAVLEVDGARRRRQRARQGPAAVHRVRGAGGLHLLLRAAGAGADRLRQGHPDLPRDHRGGHLPAASSSAAGTTIFDAAEEKMATTNPATGKPTGVVHPRRGAATGPTRRWLSARRWRCSCTRTRSPRSCRRKSRNMIRRNAAILPAYSLLLGLLALLGYVAIAAGTKPIGLDGTPNPQLVDPAAVRGRRSRPGSPGSPSRRSRSVRWCRRRSCRSRRRTCSPATSTGLHQARRDAAAGGQGLQDRRRSW